MKTYAFLLNAIMLLTDTNKYKSEMIAGKERHVLASQLLRSFGSLGG